MKKTILLPVVFGCILSCGPKVMVPPEINLKQFNSVGIIKFGSNTEGRLEDYTTLQFLQSIRESQSSASIIELGNENDILSAIGSEKFNVDAIKEIGRKYYVDGLITGRIEVSDIKPKIGLSSFVNTMNVEANVNANLTTRLFDTRKGTTIWVSTANDKKTVARVSMFSGSLHFDADNPDEAYGELVRSLVNKVTKDLRVRYVRAKK